MSESIILLDMVYDKSDLGLFVWSWLSDLKGRYTNWRGFIYDKEYKIYWSHPYAVSNTKVLDPMHREFIEIVDLEEVI